MKNRSSVTILLFILWCSIVTSAQAPLFYDDFSAGSGNWVPLSGNPQIDATGGVLAITNNEASYAIVKHDSLLTDFTFSVYMKSLTPQYSTLGVVFCLSDNGHGYYFALNNTQQFSIAVMQTGKLLYAAPNSHVHPTENILTISKYNSQISVFCNGNFLTTVTDTANCSGDIALLVPPATSAQYDDATITDVPADPDLIPCFADNFNDNNLNSWYSQIADGEATAVSEAMQITIPVTGKGSNVWVNGDFDSASVKGVVTYQSGSADSLYGISLSMITITPLPTGLSTTYNILAFLVNNNRRYAKMSPEGQITTYSPQSTITGTTDTLEIVWTANNYQFIANGTVIDSLAVDATFKPITSGFFVGGDLTVTADDFLVAPDGTCPIQEPTRGIQPFFFRSNSVNESIVIYDLMGRNTGLNRYRDLYSKGNLIPDGVYLAVQKSGNRVHAMKVNDIGIR